MPGLNELKGQTTPAKPPHVVLIDDDPLFLEVMTRIGRQRGVEVTTCRSLVELAMIAVVDVFDVAIIDFLLDGLKSNLRGTDIATLLKEIPVVLISSGTNELEEPSQWPAAVKAFVSKKDGPTAILRAAVQEAKSHRLKLLAGLP